MSLLLLKFFWLKRWCNNFSDVYWLFVFLLRWIAYLYTFFQLRSLKDVYFFIIDSYELFIYYLTHLLNWKTSPVVTHLGTLFKVYFSSIILSNVSDLYNSVFCISLERTFPTKAPKISIIFYFHLIFFIILKKKSSLISLDFQICLWLAILHVLHFIKVKNNILGLKTYVIVLNFEIASKLIIAILIIYSWPNALVKSTPPQKKENMVQKNVTFPTFLKKGMCMWIKLNGILYKLKMPNT